MPHPAHPAHPPHTSTQPLASAAAADELHSVSIDGPQINFALRPSSPLLTAATGATRGAQAAAGQGAAAEATAAATPRVTFFTVRPADYQVGVGEVERGGVGWGLKIG